MRWGWQRRVGLILKGHRRRQGKERRSRSSIVVDVHLVCWKAADHLTGLLRSLSSFTLGHQRWQTRCGEMEWRRLLRCNTGQFASGMCGLGVRLKSANPLAVETAEGAVHVPFAIPRDRPLPCVAPLERDSPPSVWAVLLFVPLLVLLALEGGSEAVFVTTVEGAREESCP